jgi:hypothetical protein
MDHAFLKAKAPRKTDLWSSGAAQETEVATLVHGSRQVDCHADTELKLELMCFDPLTPTQQPV